jgi:hypothetical protein
VSKDLLITSLGLSETEFQAFQNEREWIVTDNDVKFPQGTKPVNQKLGHEKIEFSRMF